MKVLFDRGSPPRSLQIETDRPIHDGPCLLVAVSVLGGSQGSTVHFYDGLNAQGLRLLTIAVGAKSTILEGLPDGILFDRGMYIAGATDQRLVTVSYYPGSIDRPAVEVESE